jgi:hypothetical protein
MTYWGVPLPLRGKISTLATAANQTRVGHGLLEGPFNARGRNDVAQRCEHPGCRTRYRYCGRSPENVSRGKRVGIGY